MGFFSGLLDLLFPPKCVLCRSVLWPGSTGLCSECAQWARERDMIRKGTFFGRCAIALPYEDRVRDAVHRFKFGDQPGCATAFGHLLADTIRSRLKDEYEIITWVPVSRKRRRERGYDQAMLLAMAASLDLGDVAVETLKKTVDNPKQSTLSDPEVRRENVQGVYQVTEPELVAGKRILVIDDVITTGATLEEASRTLLMAGASYVVCAALCSPMKDRINTEEESI